jgi:hypothetical protein
MIYHNVRGRAPSRQKAIDSAVRQVSTIRRIASALVGMSSCAARQRSRAFNIGLCILTITCSPGPVVRAGPGFLRSAFVFFFTAALNRDISVSPIH